MHEQKLKNYVIGAYEYNGDFYIESIVQYNNIQKDLLTNFLLDKKDKNLSSQNFPFKIIKKLKKIYILKKEINLDIKEIEKKLSEIIKNYNYIIEVLQSQIQQFKKRNDELILFVKEIIRIYNCSLNSKRMTKEIILSTKYYSI